MKSFKQSKSLAALMGASMMIAASVPAFSQDATPFFSVYAGAGSWSSEISGDVGDTNTSVDDLRLSDESNAYFYVALEHPVPVIPNVRLEHINITSDGNAELSEIFQFDDIAFDADVASEIDMTFLDATLYYELLMFDFGVTLRQFDVELSAVGEAQGETQADSEKVDGVLPMLYAQTRIDLPTTGLYVTGAGNLISYDGKSVTDLRAAVGYGIEIPVLAEIGLELGYRAFTIDLGDDEDLAGDIEFSGVYFGANIKF